MQAATGQRLRAHRVHPLQANSSADRLEQHRGRCRRRPRQLNTVAAFTHGVSKSRIVSFPYNIISSLQTRRTTRREQVARLFQDRGAGLSPCARNTIRDATSHSEGCAFRVGASQIPLGNPTKSGLTLLQHGSDCLRGRTGPAAPSWGFARVLLDRSAHLQLLSVSA
jgi:hypothetical protein